ncbi:hypothetical protein KUTeg_007646 [Tegillarca granosa]|uniref:Uncharacterized protein n=1 Tax=Tegillarca granosa TaxID=220873 RepID=A0ABQ9FFT8_TEGGR|nr:hypothetical protein KUTeg_007646 [Tegillarca granosa]
MCTILIYIFILRNCKSYFCKNQVPISKTNISSYDTKPAKLKLYFHYFWVCKGNVTCIMLPFSYTFLDEACKDKKMQARMIYVYQKANNKNNNVSLTNIFPDRLFIYIMHDAIFADFLSYTYYILDFLFDWQGLAGFTIVPTMRRHVTLAALHMVFGQQTMTQLIFIEV